MKKFITNTVLFICVLSFVVIFSAIFGKANTLTGIGTMVGFLVLLRKDLTARPGRNFIILLTIYLSLGIFSYLSNLNLIVGFFINFISLSAIGYFLSYDLTKALIVPIGLLYLFMHFSPVTGKDFALRMAALAISPCLIMLLQLIIHKKESNMLDDDRSVIKKIDPPVLETKEYHFFGKTYHLNPVRLSYSLRIGLLTAITSFFAMFLLNRYNIPEGRWMVYTIFSVTQLYSTDCRIRSKQRFIGTLIGGAIIFILFLFIQDTMIRGLLVLLFGYLNTYFTDYRDSIIIITISAVGSSSLSADTGLMVFYRILFVGIGILVALIGDYLLFPQERSAPRQSS